MITTLKELTPVARKEHRCMFCNCIIHVGEKYKRLTELFDGTVYDWIEHEDCSTVASLLNMYDNCDDGLDDTGFQESIDEYLAENYRDPEIDDIPERIDNMSRIEQVRMILADFDKPFIKIPRLKRLLHEYERRERWKNVLSVYEAKRRDEIKAELKSLEEIQ